MPLQPSFDDYCWLVSPAAAAWLMEAAAGPGDVRLVQRLRKHLSPARAHLVMEQVELRVRAKAKFSWASRGFFTRVGLQQATDEVVAGYKAGRFSSGTSVADLCCGIGGDFLALAARGSAVGVDRFPIAALLAGANLAAAGCADATRGHVLASDAMAFPLEDVTAWHVDPDRRPAGRRTTDVEAHEPSDAAIDRLLRRNCNAALKVAPAATIPERWAHDNEQEWISRGRECKQLVLWTGELGRHHGRRTATVLGRGSVSPRTVVERPSAELHIAASVQRLLYEPDPAVLAAGLTASLAEEHELSALATKIAYLTSDRAIDDPACRRYEVLEVLPYDLRKLKAALSAHGIGRVEVKKRGIELDPAIVQRKLRGRGDDHAVLLIAPLAEGVRAIIAKCPA